MNIKKRGRIGIFYKRSLEIAKETELGKECQMPHGSPRRDAETKAYIEKLQMFYYGGSEQRSAAF